MFLDIHFIMYTACGKSLLLLYCTSTQIKISKQFLYVVRTHLYLSFLALNLFLCLGLCAKYFV